MAAPAAVPAAQSQATSIESASQHSWSGKAQGIHQEAIDAMRADGRAKPDLRINFGEFSHKRVQEKLATKGKGAPGEQASSAAARLRNTRKTEVNHSSMMEPLSSYKSLEPCRPRWKSSVRRFHLTDGIRVIDQDTICISARDSFLKTGAKGEVKHSTGYVTYSASHKDKVELDVTKLAELVREGVPGGGHAWTPKQLERVFRGRTGRKGSWATYDVPFREFLRTFPKSFELFGPKDDYVRCVSRSTSSALDKGEDAMVRLARARANGMVDPKRGTQSLPDLNQEKVSQHLSNHRLKAVFTPYMKPHAQVYTRSATSTSTCLTQNGQGITIDG